MNRRLRQGLQSLVLGGWAALAAAGCSAGTGQTEGTAMGSHTTALVTVYDRIVRAGIAGNAADLRIAYDAQTHRFASDGADAETAKIADVLNGYLDESSRAVLGAEWATVRKSSTDLFATLAAQSNVSERWDGRAGSWMTDPETGKIFRAPINRLSWTAANQDACPKTVAALASISSALAKAADDGDLRAAIHLSGCRVDGDGQSYVTHDPPSDGTTPTSVVNSYAGASAATVAVDGLGCLPVSTPVGKNCVLAPFTGDYPNIVSMPTVVGNITWPAYKAIATTRSCNGQNGSVNSSIKCVMQ